MEDIDENESRPSTFLDIKENMKDLGKLRYLASILINSLNEIAIDRKNLKESLERFE